MSGTGTIILPGNHLYDNGSGNGFEDEITEDSPMFWFKLDDASTPAVNDGSESGSATVAGGVTFEETALYNDGGTAYLFDGTTGYIDFNLLNGNTNLTSFTVEGAINVDNLTQNHTLMGMGRQGNAAYAGYTIRAAVTTGKWVLEWYRSPTWYSPSSVTAAVTATQNEFWAHVVDWTNQTWDIYKNGSWVEQVALPALGPNDAGYYTDNLTWGARRNLGMISLLEGHMDNLLFFSGKLSAPRIAAHATAGGY